MEIDRTRRCWPYPMITSFGGLTGDYQALVGTLNHGCWRAGEQSTDTKKLGKRIRLARVERDLTQTALARKIRAKQKSISRYETGASVPTIDTLMKIASALKKPPSYFLKESR